MELAQAGQVQIEELVNRNFDLAIYGFKPNERFNFLQNNYQIKSLRTLFLINTDDPKESRKKDSKPLLEPGFEILHADSNNSDRIVEYIESLTNRLKINELCILIDYSCMTKLWYAAIIKYLYLKDISCERVMVYFAYVPISFSEPRKREFKRDLQVILRDPIYINPNITQKALVMGLGYEVEKSEFIIQKIQPTIIFYLLSNPAFDERYTSKVLSLNSKIIHNNPGKLMPYPIANMDISTEILTSLVLDLRLHFQVILAPFGPKLLTLLCSLLFTRFPDIEIISAVSEQHSNSHQIPINLPIIYKAVFLADEKCE